MFAVFSSSAVICAASGLDGINRGGKQGVHLLELLFPEENL